MLTIAFIWSILVGLMWGLTYIIGFVGAVGLAVIVIWIVTDMICKMLGD